MKATAWFAPVVAWGIFAAAVFAEEPKAPAAPAAPESVALLPKECIAFIHLPNLKTLDEGLKRLARETGIEIAKGDHPVRDILVERTGIEMGLDPAGSVTVGFLDPKKFRDRYTVYVLPVADWDAMLKGTRGEVPSAMNPPPGCPFHPRCPWAFERCPAEAPQLLPMPDDPDHLVSCHLCH